MSPTQDSGSPTEDQLQQQIDLIVEEIRELKMNDAPQNDLDKAYAKHRALKCQLQEKIATNISTATAAAATSFDRRKFEDLLQRRFFYDQSHALYGGTPGLVDYGPFGAALQNNLQESWRRFFVQEENMLELNAAMLTPEKVLSASGHVANFTQHTVRCKKTGDMLRADRLLRDYCTERLKDATNAPLLEEQNELKHALRTLPTLSMQTVYALLKTWKVRSPGTKKGVREPAEISELVEAQIAPVRSTGSAFLRPEGTHNAVVHFKRLLEYNQNRLPFGVAQVGTMFQNAVPAPHRDGFLNTREFCVFEINHFDAPDSSCGKLKPHKGHNFTLYTREQQEKGNEAKRRTLQDCIGGVVKNEAMLYYMARCSTYFKKIGVDVTRVRYRQLSLAELPHYAAKDAWDVEVHTSNGWTKVVSIVDRGTYDAEAHSLASGTRIVADVRLESPTSVNTIELQPVVEKIEKHFKNLARAIYAELKEYTGAKADAAEKSLKEENKLKLQVAGEKVKLTREMVVVRKCTKQLDRQEITPAIVQLTFFVPRLMHAIVEHAFRDLGNRLMLELRPHIAPYHCLIIPKSGLQAFATTAENMHRSMLVKGIRSRLDTSTAPLNTLMRQAEETGTPYCIIIGLQSLVRNNPRLVKVRHNLRNITVHIEVKDAVNVLADLIGNKEPDKIWSELAFKIPRAEVPDDPEVVELNEAGADSDE